MADTFDDKTLSRIAESVRFTESFFADPKARAAGKYAFELLTDASGGKAYARILSIDEAVLVQSFAMLKYKWNVIDGAKAGYKGDCTAFNGVFYLDMGPCPTRCVSAGTITPGTPAAATVGTPYTYTVPTSGLNAASVSMAGLPPGLVSSTSGVITGTPTTAGKYPVIVTGTAPKTGGGTCTLKEALFISVGP